jgi:hypothetical protein
MMLFLTSAVIAAHTKILALNQNTPYNMLTETQAFSSSIVYNQVLPPKLWWSDDCSKVSIDGETIELEVFQSRIRKMFKTA